MHIGELRRQITLQRETQVPDGAGGYALGWQDIATVAADIQPLSGSKVYTAQHLEGHVTHDITIRYLSGITADMRALYNGRAFNIRAVINKNERNQWLTLLAEEGGAV